MNTSDYIKSIIEHYGMSMESAASAMFPDRDYAIVALKNVLSGKTDVKMKNFIYLLRAAGVNVEEALTSVLKLKGSMEEDKLTLKSQFGTIKIKEDRIEFRLDEEPNITIVACYDSTTKLTDVKEIVANRIAHFFNATNI
jgi:spore maturation protein SpmB